MRFSIDKAIGRHAAGIVVGVVVFVFGAGLAWWAATAEVRSVDRRLDVAGQTLVEETHGELDEIQRNLAFLAWRVAREHPRTRGEFTQIAALYLPDHADAAEIEVFDGEQTVRYTTDSEWLDVGTDPGTIPGWHQINAVGLDASLPRSLPSVPGYERLVIAQPIGPVNLGAITGVIVMAVDIETIVNSTVVAQSLDGPTIRVRELAATEPLATSEPLIHREYLLLDDRRWLVEVLPAEGTTYAVSWQQPTAIALLATMGAIASAVATDFIVRRRRIQHALEISTGLNSDKDRFLLALSHQIRTPLTAVVGFLDLLRGHDDLDPVERTEFLNRAADHADEVAAIVHDILVVTRDDMDLLMVTTQPTNPVREAIAVASSIPLGESSTIDINPELSEAPLALGDPVRVRQIIRNLVANAIRHGGRSVHISTHRLGSEVVVVVADDGPGLPDEVARRLHRHGPGTAFDAETSGETRSDSLGLGLRVAWLLAERMGGRIEYRRSGSLTMFELILPAAPRVSGDGSPAPAAQAAETP